ncbi:glycosyltransferase [bacterium Scap17]|nr:glycosyltransferase [bacterium Scap17]
MDTHDINLTILGKGQQESELKEYAKHLKIEEKVTFVEENKEPLSLIFKHDIFVLSSIYEGFGNVLVEAMAVGCPVVSTKCAGGPVEILDNGNYGPLVDIQNPQQLSQAIIEVYTLPIDRQKLISRSMQYEVEYISKQYIDFFKL